MSSSKDTKEQTSGTTTTSIDPWEKSLLSENYDFAKNAGDTLQQQGGTYGQPRFAAFNPAQLQSQGMITDIANNKVGSDTLSQAIAAAHGASSYAPAQVTGQTYQAAQGANGDLTGVDLSKYMNPYEQQVIDATQNDFEMARERQRLANSADATKAGAWRGTQLGVTNSLSDEASNRALLSQLANERSSNYTQATGLAEQDLARGTATGLSNAGFTNQASLANADATQKAQEANQNAGLAGAQLNLQGSQDLSGLSQQQLAQALQYAGLIGGVGDLQHGQDQQTLDFNYQEFLRKLGLSTQASSLRNAAIGLIPYSGTATSSGTQNTQETSSNPLGTIGSLLGTAASLGFAPFTGGASLAGLGAVAGLGNKSK